MYVQFLRTYLREPSRLPQDYCQGLWILRPNPWTKSRQKSWEYSSLFIHSHSYSFAWDLYFFKLMQPLTVSVKEKVGKPDRKPYPLPNGLINTETSSLRTIKIMPRNLNVILRSCIRLLILSGGPRARISKPIKKPRNRFPAWRAGTKTLFDVGTSPQGYRGWRNRFLGIDSRAC